MKEFFELRRLTGTISINLEGRGKWSCGKLTLCQNIISIVEKYARQGYRLTLRQLYYQLVSADAIPNHDKVYKKLSGVLDDLRYSGKIDWSAIEDRGRVPYLPYFVEGVKHAIEDTIRTYRINRQAGQETVVEVWTEKDAISGILKRITTKYHVRLVVNKGYSSSTAMHDAYQRFASYINSGKKVVILYFGDHDPSGLDMVRDIKDRIEFFLSKGNVLDVDEEIFAWWSDTDYNLYDVAYYADRFERVKDLAIKEDDGLVELFEEGRKRMFLEETRKFQVKHIGLTTEQVKQFNPPPNPAKISDPRAKWYIKQHGAVSWEVDALEPRVMEGIVRDAIEEIIDISVFEQCCHDEKEQIEEMKIFAAKFDENSE